VIQVITLLTLTSRYIFYQTSQAVEKRKLKQLKILSTQSGMKRKLGSFFNIGFNPVTFLCLSQVRTWISNVICHGLLCIQNHIGGVMVSMLSVVDHEFES
jgi:hypothetical protein